MKNILIIFFILISATFCFSQNQNFRKVKPYTWMIGVYWNTVIDDGYGTKYLLDVPNSWNAPIFPSAVNVDVYLMKGMSLDFLASGNEYKLGKRIDKDTSVSGLFFSFDAHFKYSFSYLMYQQWFDPFVFAGISYTGREALHPQNMFGASFGAGINLMIANGVGLQFRGSGNMGFLPGDSNYGQVHAGFIYKFPDVLRRKNRDFSKRKYQWGFKKPRSRRPRKGNM